MISDLGGGGIFFVDLMLADDKEGTTESVRTRLFSKMLRFIANYVS